MAPVATRTPLDPIRVYAGLASPSAQERADLAVAELERTGAFDRAVVAIVTTTGTGWVNPRAEALELMYGGDTAVVATQYSYLPSWLSFLVDRSRSEEAGRLLFDAVHARMDQLSEDTQPRLRGGEGGGAGVGGDWLVEPRGDDVSRHGLVPSRHVLAGHRRPDPLAVGARRARAPTTTT